MRFHVNKFVQYFKKMQRAINSICLIRKSTQCQMWLETEMSIPVCSVLECCQQTLKHTASTRTQSQRMMMAPVRPTSHWSVVWRTAGSGVTFSPSISVHCSSLCRLYVSFVWIYGVKQVLFPDCVALLLPGRELSSLYLSDPWHTLISWHFSSEKSVTPSKKKRKSSPFKARGAWTLVSFPWTEKTLLRLQILVILVSFYWIFYCIFHGWTIYIGLKNYQLSNAIFYTIFWLLDKDEITTNKYGW